MKAEATQDARGLLPQGGLRQEWVWSIVLARGGAMVLHGLFAFVLIMLAAMAILLTWADEIGNALAAIGLFIAATALYGVMASSYARRTVELLEEILCALREKE